MTLRTCGHPLCVEPARHSCDNCGSYFCTDHGSKGGDTQVQDVGAVAYPAMCYACGGFDAWEGMTDAEIKAAEAELVREHNAEIAREVYETGRELHGEPD